MIRLTQALPLALLISVPAIAMEQKPAAAPAPVVAAADQPTFQPSQIMQINWTKTDGGWTSTTTTEASKPLTQAERPNSLLGTIALEASYTKQQAVVADLQAQEEALQKTKATQLDTLKAMVADLSRRLTGKQAALTGLGLSEQDCDKQIAKLQARKGELATEKTTLGQDIEGLKKSINQTAADVAKAEAIKKAEAKSSSWFGWGRK